MFSGQESIPPHAATSSFLWVVCPGEDQRTELNGRGTPGRLLGDSYAHLHACQEYLG